MLIARHLTNERICMRMTTLPLSAEEMEERGPRATSECKEEALGEIAAFLEKTSAVGNKRRLLLDLIHRERKASTAVGRGLAVPHVRTMNVKEPIVAFMRSLEGLEFDAPDGDPTHIFVVLVAPPWDDKLHLKLYREVAELFLRDDVLPWLLDAASESDVLRFFRSPEQFHQEW